MTRKWWWPFGESAESQAESQFLAMLQEASVRTDDLRQAAEDMRADRLKRVQESGRSPSIPEYQVG